LKPKLKKHFRELIMAKNANDKSVQFLYGTKGGRILLHAILALRVPKLLGVVLRSPFSKLYINSFIKKNNIDIDGSGAPVDDPHPVQILLNIVDH
jgi:hypothetical protein